MSEVISLHLGQAGVQIGQSLWELYCLEHGILPSGEPDDAVRKSLDDDSVQAIFSESTTGKRVPRAVLIDTEPSVIGEL